MKIYQEAYDNFCRNFCKKINMRRGANSKDWGTHSNRIKKTGKN